MRCEDHNYERATIRERGSQRCESEAHNFETARLITMRHDEAYDDARHRARAHLAEPPPTEPSVRVQQPSHETSGVPTPGHECEREFFFDNLLLGIHFILEMIWWTGLAPWEFEFSCPGASANRRGSRS